MSRHQKKKSKKRNSSKNSLRTPSLSLCMIVKNEEKYLAGCLESVQGIVDDIVIVDTGSTDATIEIAKKYNARIFHFEWIDDFSAARNESLRNAAGNWILYLDADERLMQPNKKYIKKLLKRNDVGAYYITVLGEQQYRDRKQQLSMPYPRLFRKDPRIKFEGKVHEQVGPSVERAGFPIVWCDLKIEHLGYDQSWEVIEEKCQRNAELLHKQIADNPDDFYARFQLGNTLSMLGNVEEADSVLTEMLSMDGITKSIYASAYNLLGAHRINEGNYDKGIEYCVESLHYANYQVMARWFIANAYIKYNDYHQAAVYLEEMRQILDGNMTVQNKTLPSYDLQIEKTTVLNELGKCYLMLEETGKAHDAFSGSLSLDITGDALDGLVQIYKHESRYEQACELVSKSLQANPRDPKLYEMMVELNMERGSIPDARKVLTLAEENDITSFTLQKYAAQISLDQKDVHTAFEQLKKMRSVIPPERQDLLERIDMLERKLEGSGG